MQLQDVNVVIIEDNIKNLKLFEALLVDQIGVNSYFACNSGESFFDWLQSNPSNIPDLILLDIQLPKENGYKVIQRIHQEARLEHTKVVAVTASVLEQDQEHIREAGFDGLLGKPIRVLIFEDQLKRILAGEIVWHIR